MKTKNPPSKAQSTGTPIPSSTAYSRSSVRHLLAVEPVAGLMNGSDGPSLEIYYKDEKVTGTTKDVWVGQLISLVAKTDPAGQNIEDPIWTVPDKIVAGYKVSEPNKGEVIKFEKDSLKGGSVWFYWVTGGEKIVTFRGTVNDVIIDVQATFNVRRPEVSMVVNNNDAPELHYIEGAVAFLKSVELERKGSADEGKLGWVQLIDTITVVVYDSSYAMGPGWHSAGNGLDGETFLYPPDPDSPLFQDNAVVGDSRRVALNIRREDKAEDWIMFKHKQDGSIWVPLKKVTWSWSVYASQAGNTGNWTIDSVDYTKDINATDSDEFPVWDSHISDPPDRIPLGQ